MRGRSELDFRVVRKKVMLRDSGMCVFCGGKDNLEVHHLIPFRISGCNKEDELVVVCQGCHNIFSIVETWDIICHGKDLSYKDGYFKKKIARMNRRRQIFNVIKSGVLSRVTGADWDIKEHSCDECIGGVALFNLIKNGSFQSLFLPEGLPKDFGENQENSLTS